MHSKATVPAVSTAFPRLSPTRGDTTVAVVYTAFPRLSATVAVVYTALPWAPRHTRPFPGF